MQVKFFREANCARKTRKIFGSNFFVREVLVSYDLVGSHRLEINYFEFMLARRGRTAIAI